MLLKMAAVRQKMHSCYVIVRTDMEDQAEEMVKAIVLSSLTFVALHGESAGGPASMHHCARKLGVWQMYSRHCHACRHTQ